MEVAPRCPDVEVLEQLSLGRIAPEEMDRLAEHCESCARCMQTLERLRGQDTLVEALRARSTAGGPPLPERVTRVGPVPDGPSEPTREAWDFLEPPRGEGEIGRLGAYRVLRLLGAGGMGVVFLAEDPELRRRVALKVMKPALAASATHRQRFLREARAMAAVQHDHIMHVNQIGQEGAIPFLAMPYLEGETLADRLRREGRLDVAEVLRIGRETAEGLAAAHQQGLIHRDIKPANIWLEGRRGRVKVLDFGLARAVDEEVRLSQPGGIIGTPAYTAPELVEGGAADFRCDLFSLGCVLYRMTTGRPPFKGRTMLETLRALELDQPEDPRQSRADVPPALCALILRLLARSPDDRPASAGELAAALHAIEQDPAPTPPPGVPGDTARPGRRFRVVALLLLAILPLGYFYGGAVLRIAPNRGELVTETDDPDTEVSIRGPNGTARDGVEARPRPADDGTGSPERMGAEYVLSVGGRVSIVADGKRREVGSVAELPKESFSLIWVILHGNKRVTDAGLACFEGCTSLTQLNMNDTRVGDAGLSHFAGCTSLRQLSLCGTRVSDAGLAHFRSCKSLTHLHLQQTAVGDAGLAHLGGCKDLTVLALMGTRVSDAGLASFNDCKKLTHLNLAGTQVSDAGLAPFESCKGLKSLYLSGTRVTDAGLAHFKGCKGLTELCLDGTRVTDAGLAHFKGCKSLTHLFLHNTQVSDAGLAHFRSCKDLRGLVVTGSRVTAPMLAEFSKALPRCRITHDGGTIEPPAAAGL